ncbi:MAG: hypothetical protein AAF985_19635, partial [Bacteroidota bacterium]
MALFCGRSWAQNPQPIFRNFTTDNGLPSSETYVVFQDSKDYIWITTDNGVSRYDGYQFRNFSAKDGLRDAVVFHLHEDAQGRIWMNTLSHDFYYYENGRIYPFAHNDIVQQFYDSKKGTSQGFYVAEDGTFYTNIPSKGILEIKPDGAYQLFRPQTPGFAILKEIGPRAFYQISLPAEADKAAFYQKYRAKGILPDIELHGDSIQYIQGIKNNYGVYRFTNCLNRVAKEEYLFFHGGYLSRIKEGQLLWTIDCPYRLTQNSLYAEPGGQVFLGAINGGGVYQYENLAALKAGEGRHFLDGYSVTSVMKDRKGGYWFSTIEQGVFYTPVFNLLVYDRRMGLPGDLIKGISIKSDDAFWISLRNGGLFLIDVRQNKVERMPDAPFDSENWDLKYDQKRKVLWKGGDYLSYWENGTWENILLASQSYNKKVTKEVGNKRINFSEDGRFLWGADRLGFVKVDLERKTIVDDSRRWEIEQRTFVVYEDRQERVWVGNKDGLFEYRNHQLIPPEINHRALRLRIEDIGQLSDGTLVIGTKGEGIVLIKEQSVQTIGAIQGLSSNMIENIFVDEQDQIWVGTLVGLNRIKLEVDQSFYIEQITTA